MLNRDILIKASIAKVTFKRSVYIFY